MKTELEMMSNIIKGMMEVQILQKRTGETQDRTLRIINFTNYLNIGLLTGVVAFSILNVVLLVIR